MANKFSSRFFMEVLSWTVDYMITKGYAPDTFSLLDKFSTYKFTQDKANDTAKAVSEQFGIKWCTTKIYDAECLLSFMQIPFQWQCQK